LPPKTFLTTFSTTTIGQSEWSITEYNLLIGGIEIRRRRNLLNWAENKRIRRRSSPFDHQHTPLSTMKQMFATLFSKDIVPSSEVENNPAFIRIGEINCPIAEKEEMCVLCGIGPFSDRALSVHFDTCFQQHCPMSIHSLSSENEMSEARENEPSSDNCWMRLRSNHQAAGDAGLDDAHNYLANMMDQSNVRSSGFKSPTTRYVLQQITLAMTYCAA
jgi:hypothetical protein